jgi:hypothetical protein
MDPGSDPTPFFGGFNDAKEREKKKSIVFLVTESHAYYLSVLKIINFLLKFYVKLFFAFIISVRSTPL